jgi:ribosomal protein S18 acetylase RimI-like enzyme
MLENSTIVRAALSCDAPFIASVWKSANLGCEQLESRHFIALLQDCECRVYVAQSQSALVGYMTLRRAAHVAVVAQNPLQLWQIYVEPTFHGVDVAEQLMSTARTYARSHKHDVIWLGVSENNARGMAFYRKNDFKVVGQYQVGSAEHAHHDIVMSCAVN